MDPTATITQCTTAGGTLSLSGRDNAEKIWNYFKEKGLSDNQIAGIIGNMQQESGLNPLRAQVGPDTDNPAQFGSAVGIGRAWGLIQWDAGGRAIEYAKKAGITSPIGALGTQLDLVWWHLNNQSPTGAMRALDRFKQTTTIPDAVRTYEKLMEGAGTPMMETRIKYANQAFINYGGSKSGSIETSSADSETSGVDSSSQCGGSNFVTSTTCDVTAPLHGESGTKDNKQLSKSELISIYGEGGPGAKSNMVMVDFLGKKVEVHKLIAGCLNAVANEIKTNKIQYEVKEIGGYRTEKGIGRASVDAGYHWYGVALDINPSTNPYNDGGAPMAHDIPQSVVDAFRHHGFSWGGNWSRPKDYMHFEFNGLDPK